MHEQNLLPDKYSARAEITLVVTTAAAPAANTASSIASVVIADE